MPILGPTIEALDIDPREISAYVHCKMYENIYTALFIITQNRKAL